MTNRHIKFGDLYLNEQFVTVEPQAESKVKAAVNHIWLVDRSGSMSQELPRLIEDLKQRHRELAAGDTLSFGYFSSEGQYRFVFKGLKLTTEEDHNKLDQELNKYKQSLSLTCFSEILEDSLNVIEELSWISTKFALWLFTDGYPVVGNYKKEVENIRTALGKLESKLTSAQFIGYGDYYNKELLSEMSSIVGGELRHCSDQEDYGQAMTDFIEGMPTTKKVKVELQGLGEILSVFTTHSGICSYEQAFEEVLVSPPNEGNRFSVYFISNSVASNSQEIVINEENYGGYILQSLIDGALAGAVVLNQRIKTADAIALLAAIGNTFLFNNLSQAFTAEEHGDFEKGVADLLKSDDVRYLDGYQANPQPNKNAFCVLDLLDKLVEHKASFLPTHPEFKYKRTGRKTVTVEGYPEFQPIKGASSDIAGLTWNSSKLSLSALVKVPGIVYLPDASSVGLVAAISTYVWRNYTIIKDGHLWTSKLPVALSDKGILDIFGGEPENWGSGSGTSHKREDVLDLDYLPLINQAIAESASQPGAGQTLANLAVEDEVLGARLKVYKYLLAQVTPEQASFEGYTEEQTGFLQSKGITKNGFSPPTVKEDVTDQYQVKTFELKVAGWSSLPKVEKAVEILESKHTTNSIPLAEMVTTLMLFKTHTKNCTDEVIKGWLECQIEVVKKRQRELRSQVQRSKFSVILGKQWFPEFDSRDSCSLQGQFEGVQAKVSFVLGEATVKI